MTYANLAFPVGWLPNWVVSASITNTFKANLDKFWHNHDIVYDLRAQLQGTGSRSLVLLTLLLTLCGLASSDSTRSLGLSELVHEKAHPIMSKFI